MNDSKEYRWETGYEKSWEEMKDVEYGSFSALTEKLSLLEQKKNKQNGKVVRLGMMRHLCIIVDLSESMLDQDMKPTRQICTLKLLEKFIKEFLEQNPIGQLGIIITRNKRAEKISELSGNGCKHLLNLELCNNPNFCAGEPSLQNSLELALSSMKMLPSHSSREILVIYGSLSTCDPGDIKDTIESLKINNVQASVISLSADIFILKKVCNITGGQYEVVLDDNQYRELLFNFVKPRSVPKNSAATCVKMGFPHHLEKLLPLTSCMCHLNDGLMNKPGYFCPQCNSKYCELPVECITCGITLVTSAHLVRPLHYLIPIHVFKDLAYSPNKAMHCYGCQRKVTERMEQISICNNCKQLYCKDCDLFIHSSLHVCPGCVAKVGPA